MNWPGAWPNSCSLRHKAGLTGFGPRLNRLAHSMAYPSQGEHRARTPPPERQIQRRTFVMYAA